MGVTSLSPQLRAQHRVDHCCNSGSPPGIRPTWRELGTVRCAGILGGERCDWKRHRAAIHGTWIGVVDVGSIPFTGFLGMGARPGRHVAFRAVDHDGENCSGEQRGYAMDSDSLGIGRNLVKATSSIRLKVSGPQPNESPRSTSRPEN